LSGDNQKYAKKKYQELLKLHSHNKNRSHVEVVVEDNTEFRTLGVMKKNDANIAQVDTIKTEIII